MAHSTITSFTNPQTLAVNAPTRFDDYHTLRTNEVYLDSNTTKGVRPATSTASTVTGSLVFSTQNMTITSSGNTFTFTVATAAGGIISLANTTTGSTITGSAIIQNGAFIASSINGQTFHLTNTGIGSFANTSAGSTVTSSVIFQPGANVGITASGQTFNFSMGTAIDSIANTTSGSTITTSVIFQPGANVGITISGQTFNFTATSSGGGATSTSFRAYATTNQVITPGTHTKLAFSLEVFDIGGLFDTVDTRAEPPTTGIYLFGGVVKGSWTSSPFTTFRLYRNSAVYRNLIINNQATTADGGISGMALVEVTATTDFYELYIKTDNSLTVIHSITDSYFYGSKIGDR